MKRFVVAAIVPLVASFGIALTPAIPVSANTPICGGTHLDTGAQGEQVRVPTVSDTSTQFDCDLGPGSPSVPVMRLQIDLNACNGDHLMVDGIYGQATMAAVKSEQQAEGLPASEQDGLYGPITIDGFRRGFLYETRLGVPPCDFLANGG